MAAGRTIVTVSWSLQRIRHGEQAPWMGLTLAAMLGQIGLPGGGFGHGYGSMNEPGLPPLRCRLPSLPQGPNPVQTFIPVAAISDMLLHPGESVRLQRATADVSRHQAACTGPAATRFTTTRTSPDCGAHSAGSTPIVVHDPYWTAMAKHADIVVPSTTAFERDDYSGSRNDPLLMAMPKLAEPYAQSRDDYTRSPRWPTASGSASSSPRAAPRGSGSCTCTTSGPPDWISRCRRSTSSGRTGRLRLPTEDGLTLLADFRADPNDAPAGTRPAAASRSSRKTSTGSATTTARATRSGSSRPNGSAARARLDYPLHLLANQPATRLHSQLDIGAVSQGSKVQGREPIRMHPADAAARGLADGDVVRVFNDRGACLAGVVVDDRLRRDVVQLSTGAWFDPADPADPDAMCVHGNPNVLTDDAGTSSLARGCTGAHVLVQVEKFDGPLPPVRAHQPPVIVDR